jgi:spore germination protein
VRRAAAVLILGACLPASAGLEPPARLSSWVVYWDAERGMESLDRDGAALDEVAVFAAHFGEDGRLKPANGWVAGCEDRFRRWRRRVLLSVVNDVEAADGSRLKDPAAVHAAVSSPDARRRHVEEILALGGWADGVEIDYERIDMKDRESFTFFIRELSAALRERGKTLSVVVEPKTHDAWKDGAGAVDWAAVGREADQVKVMAYFEHHERGRPGPLASPAWVARVARFALTQVPREKLWVALTVAGIDWPEGAPGRQVDYAKVRALGLRARRDRASRTPRLAYKDGAGRRHEVWFEDAKSIAAKRAALAREGVTRVALWRMGVGDPALWRGVREEKAEMAQSR